MAFNNVEQTRSALTGRGVCDLRGAENTLSSAETLCPFPDGVCVQAQRDFVANPAHLDLSGTLVQRKRIKSNFFLRGSGGSGVCDGRRSITTRACRMATKLMSESVGCEVVNKRRANDGGYWMVRYVTVDGTEVGSSKVMAPSGEEPITVEVVLGIIGEHAALLNLKVIYVTYLDKDFGTYALLTPRTVYNSTGYFCAVVEFLPGMSVQARKEKDEEGTGRTASLPRCHEREKGSIVSSQCMEKTLFRVPNVTCYAPPDASQIKNLKEEFQCMSPQFVGLVNELLQEEASRRESISFDEISSRLVLQARENTQLFFLSRYQLLN